MLVREIVASFMRQGRYILYPSRTLTQDVLAPDFARRKTDAYALDASIREAVQASDLMEAWADGFGPQARRNLRNHGRRIQEVLKFLIPLVSETDQETALAQASSRFNPSLSRYRRSRIPSLC